MITHKIENAIEKYNMLKSGDTVAVGVSGGADSMLLLNWLFDNRKRYGITVIAANVEHGIRGEASISDTRFVKAFCEEKGIDIKTLSINAPEEAQALKTGVEEYSRKRRYEFFASLGTDKIATAHSLSDNVETVLFRIARGTSVRGLCGIPPVRGNIIRPLIECTSAEIRAYCTENGIPFVVDETNADSAYSRNYIRNEIIPALEKLNPSLESAVERLINSSNEDEACLQALASKLCAPLSIAALREAPAAVAKRAIQNAAETTVGCTLDEKHLNDVYSLVFKEKGRAQLYGNIFAVNNGETLEIKAAVSRDAEPCFSVKSKTVLSEEFLKNKEKYKKEFAFYCDCDKIIDTPFVRAREPHDEITLARRNVTKSLKKLFNELDIPEEERSFVPIICDSSGVIGVYGYAVSQRVAPDENTRAYLLMKISVEDKTE